MSNRQMMVPALDHLTAVDTTPSQLISIAAALGCPAVSLFMQPMEILPLMPDFTLYGITAEARETKLRMQDHGIGLDVAYPFTLAGRTDVQSFRPALETAAWLGAGAVNALLYDRDASRRFDNVAAFCVLAEEYDLDVALEFYTPSQLPSLSAAVDLITRLDHPRAGINVDLLHLMRSGGTLVELANVPSNLLRYAQYCDGKLPGPPEGMNLDDEASSERCLGGEGGFDLAGFTAALPPGLAVSVELPQNSAVHAGVPTLERARRAVQSVCRQWARPAAA